MLSLFAFLEGAGVFVEQPAFCGDAPGLLEFLHATQLKQNHRRGCLAVPVCGQAVTYAQYVDGVVEHLLRHQPDNALVACGKQGEWYESAYTSFAVTSLKSPRWNRVYLWVGPKVFSELLLGYDCYVQTPTRVMLFGQVRNLPVYKPTQYSPPSGSKAPMLFREARQVRWLNPLPLGVMLLLAEIFPAYRAGRCPRSLGYAKRLLLRALRTHARCNYIHHIERLCPQRVPTQTASNFDLATPRRDVVAFLLYVVDHLFPIEMWGTRSNKEAVFTKIARFVNSGRHFCLLPEELVHHVKLTAIPWLGPTAKGNVQGLKKRTELFRAFMAWMFRCFIPRLVASFFHVTDGSLSLTLYYYRHPTWRALTQPFMKRYISQYLEPVADCPNHYAALDQSEYLHGKLKLLPKKRDFRVVCAPFQGREKQLQQVYRDYMYNYIKPVRDILNQKRYEQPQTSTIPRCVSVRDLVTALGAFKQELTPAPLFFLKFDIQQCYDTLPKSRVVKLLRSFLDANETYFHRKVFRSLSHQGVTNGPHARVVAGSLTADSSRLLDLNLFGTGGASIAGATALPGLGRTQPGSFMVDGYVTRKLHHDDILQIFNTHLDDATVVYRNRCFKRKRGVFQGLHLSAVLCEIFYDHFTRELLAGAPSTSAAQTLVLRLVDDFLIVTTQKTVAEHLYRVIQDGEFAQFPGINVNHVKTSTNFDGAADQARSVMAYCGLSINTTTLEVIRTHHTAFTYNAHPRSFKQAYALVVASFTAKVMDPLLSFRLNGWSLVLQNIELSLQSATQGMRFLVQGINIQGFQRMAFIRFELSLFQIAVRRLQQANPQVKLPLSVLNKVGSIISNCLDQRGALRNRRNVAGRRRGA